MQKLLTLSFLVLLIAWAGLLSVFATNSNLQLRSILPYGEQVSDVWGYNDNTGEYALVGTNTTFSIVNITDPDNPIEIHNVPGLSSTWRDIKTWQNYAYVSNESGEGLLIVDMSNLPGSIQTYYYTGDANVFLSTIHNLYIDEFGFAYIFGSNYSAGGVVILDLNTDPTNPTIAGIYDDQYVHDGYALDNILYIAEIYTGMFRVLDVSNKNNIAILGGHETTGVFAHNVWSSADNNYAFTTDEISGGFVDAYDVSDPSDIVRVDFIQSSPGMGVIPHNTHWLNNFLVTSYYKDGITIHDASVPSILVEVGNYDTLPEDEGGGFDGAWGAYPYLDSGLILASDMSNGLFVLEPTYVPAAYLVGTVTSANTGADLGGVDIEVLNSTMAEQTDLAGAYGTGTVNAGIYDVSLSKIGFNDTTIMGVELINGQTTTLDIQMTENDEAFILFGQVKDVTDETAMIDGDITFSFNGNVVTVSVDAGFYSLNPAPPADYEIIATSWGYYPTVKNIFADEENSQHLLYMIPGYYDDYVSDLGWTASGTSAFGGEWELGEPEGFVYYGLQTSPPSDISSDVGNSCYTTGEANTDDFVLDGAVTLESPAFDLSNYIDPYLSFWSFFVNFNQQLGFGNDHVRFYLDNGIEEIEIYDLEATNTTAGIWNFHNFKITDYITPTADMTFRATASADFQYELLESALDVWQVVDSASMVYEGIAENDVALAPQSATGISVSTADNDNVPCTPYYELGDYDETVFSNVEIDNAGVMTFDVDWSAVEGGYIIPYTFFCNTFVSYSAHVSVQVLTDISENALDRALNIYPNPTKGILNLELDNVKSSDYTYSILNLQGKVMSSELLMNSKETIDLSFLATGLYLLELRENGEIVDTQKLMIE